MSVSSPGQVFDLPDPAPPEAGCVLQYGTIIIVGGGCYGRYYVRQLQRANRAGALRWDRLIVVDRDPRCALAVSGVPLSAALRPGHGALPDSAALKLGQGASPDSAALKLGHGASPGPVVNIAEWEEFFSGYLSRWAVASESQPTDAIVPSPLMPHLMFGWIRNRAADRWPQRRVAVRPLPVAPSVPWERAAPDGTHYVSFATWTCPVNCIEPARCPHTRGLRTWTMPRAISEYVDAERQRGRTIEDPLVFQCTHRAYGVGMIDVAAVVAADDSVREIGERGAADFLVGTVSHCHGALSLLSVS